MDLLNSAFLLCAILLIASLSGLVSEKAGIVNIAINGMMIIGALMFCVFSSFLANKGQGMYVVDLLLVGLVVGAFALIHGLATIVLKADHVVSGTAINLLAAGMGLFLTQYLAKHMPSIANGANITQSFKSPYLDSASAIPALQTTNFVYFMIGLGLTGTIWTYFKYTKKGVAHAAVGENPNAVDSAGIKVNRIKWYAVFFSGFLAGIAGGMVMQKIGTFGGNVQGLGFVALAIMILGQWRPWIMFGSAIVFALLYAVADKYVFESIPKDVMKMIPFIASLLVLVLLSKFQSAPKAVGQHFDKAKR